MQRQLLDLPSDAFAERHQLLKRQDELRASASRFWQDRDSHRSDDELLAELAARRSQLSSIERQKIGLAAQAGGSGAGSSGYRDVGVNVRIGQAQGLGDIQARIGRLKSILTDRGVSIPGA